MARDRNMPYLAILVDKRPTGHEQVHAGLARHGIGIPMCDENRRLFEFWLPACDETFALYRPDAWRHRYAEAFLELNKGCRACLDQLIAVSREVGWTKPPSLNV
jgi:hypothetical protein